MRNPLHLFRSPARRATRRVSPRPAMTPPRRFELGRAEAKRPRHIISWRRLSLTVVAVAIAGGTAYGSARLLTGDTFRVRTIEVAGVQVADPQAVVQAAAISGASMFTLDAEQAGQAIAKLPAVKAVSVTRAWPHSVRIDITEHQAWGYWQAGTQRLVIDADGRVLQQSRPPAADAPTIVELTAPRDPQDGVVTDPDTVHLVERLRSDGTFDRLGLRPTGYFFRRDRGLTVMLANGPAAVLGDSSNYDFKVRTWQALLDQQRQHPGQPGAQGAQALPGQRPAAVSEIDLRFGRNVVLR